MFKIDKLTVDLNTAKLLDLSLEISNITALIGSSGSGKTLTIKALLDLLPKTMKKDLIISADFEMINGKSVGFVPQNPFTSLNPMSKIKNEFLTDSETIRHYLSLVGLDLDLINRFPSELSGGQLQRIIIAIALSSNPKLLLLDEPTTALDPISKDEIADLLLQIASTHKIAMLLVSHDIGLVTKVADFITVLDGGKIIEAGTKNEILQSPKTAQTTKLLESNFAMRSWRE